MLTREEDMELLKIVEGQELCKEFGNRSKTPGIQE